MVNEIILASKSEVRKKILEDNNITCRAEPSNVDEDSIKESLLKEKATPTIISKNLAELKANKISQKFISETVLGADSVIDLEGKIISKPTNRAEALGILNKLNGKTHQLVSSVCISRGGSMIWYHTDKASLTMKNMTFLELEGYLMKITDEALYAYNVYQIEGEGKNLFSKVEGNEDTIMGLPIKQIKNYLNLLE
jgi:septum formation protein